MTTGRGFTLLEMMVTLAVVVIVAAVAVPSFNRIMQSNAHRSEVSLLRQHLSKARAESISLNGQTAIRRTGETWADGWALWWDRDRDCQIDPNEVDFQEPEDVMQDWHIIHPAPRSTITAPDCVGFRAGKTTDATGVPVMAEIPIRVQLGDRCAVLNIWPGGRVESLPCP